MENAVKVKNLTRKFALKKPNSFKNKIFSIFKREKVEKIAVNNISFSIAAGELVGFIGLNGAGKTTTLKILSGLLKPTSGEVSVLGFNPIERKSSFLKQIGFIFGQKNQLFLDLPAIDSIKINAEIYDMRDDEFNKNFNELIDLFELKKNLHQKVRELSLGEKMKFEIVSSLIYKPKMLFLDEPTIGLDIFTQKKIRKFLKEYNKNFNSTIILTSHNLDDVFEICKRLIIIHEGKIICDDLISTLLKKFADEKKISFYLKDGVKTDFLKSLNLRFIEKENGVDVFVKNANVVKVITLVLKNMYVDDIDIKEKPLDMIIEEIMGR